MATQEKKQHLNMKATVTGHTCQGRPFQVDLEFILHPPKDSNHYGTGYYMTVVAPSFDYYVDVRYEGTIDIQVLADRWIKGNYGKNAEDVKTWFEEEK